MGRFQLQLHSTAFLLLSTAVAASSNPSFYSDTWAGPAQVQQNASSPFSSIEATLVMPRMELPKEPHQVVNQYTFSYWIGLDGYKSPAGSGLWQAGVIGHIFTNGTREYVPFWEWVPDPEYFVPLNDFEIVEGDHVHIVLNISTNGTLATATLNNLNTTKMISNTRSAPTGWRRPDYTVPGASAEWIVESGTYQNYTKTVLPDFGTAVFFDAKAYKQDRTKVLPGDVSGLQMFENFWADTEMLYSRCYVEGEVVRAKYVEEKCDECKTECLRAGTCSDSTTSSSMSRL